MLPVPNCYKRKCKHFLGVSQYDGTEMSEVVYCKAFTNKIPEDIAYGKNKHLSPTEFQDNDIVYEREK